MTCELSICIPTLNRGRYIGQTLESIVTQLQPDIEVVIVDGGSTDDTEQIVEYYRQANQAISYVKSEKAKSYPSNEGFSRDCDYTIELSSGKYCWLMTDDDILMPGAVRKVLHEIQNGYPLIVTAVEVRNKDLTQLLIPCRPELPRDRVYSPSEWDRFAVEVGGALTFVGSVIVNRQLWLGRNRNKYVSSGFIHVGVIFDEVIKENIFVIAQPLVSVRHGNAHWSNRTFQIWMFNWPELIWSFSSISDETKQTLAPYEAWRKHRTLLLMRALGEYSLKDYEAFLASRFSSSARRTLAKFIASLPRWLLYIPACVYLYARGSEASLVLHNLRHSFDNA